MIYDLKRYVELLERRPRRDVQPVCRKRSSVMSTKVESGERAVWASLFFPTSRATHAAQQLSSGQKWASGGQLWLCGRQGSIGKNEPVGKIFREAHFMSNNKTKLQKVVSKLIT